MHLWWFIFVPCLVDGTTLLVGTGSSTDFEIVNLANPNAICLQPKDYPHQTSWAVVGTLSGKPLICGGFNPPDKVGVTCHIYYQGGDSWYEGGWLNRIWTAGINLTPRTFFMGGGSLSRIFNETFFIEDSGVAQGPDLPEPRMAHCFVRINDHQIFVVGGNDGSLPVKTVYIYDFSTDEWTPQPQLKQVRSWAFCGSVTDSDSGTVTEIVVAGGTYQTRPLDTSEIFDLSTRSWRPGPKLATPIFSGASVDIDQSFILVGGSDGLNARDEIQTYDPKSEEFVVLAAKLRKPRQDHVAIIIDDSLGLTC